MSDDLISRQAALNELHLLAIEALRKQRRDYCAIIDICSNKIKSLPAVQPEQKIGHWIICSDGYYPYCSQCLNEPKNRIMTKYCGECGAKMGK